MIILPAPPHPSAIILQAGNSKIDKICPLAIPIHNINAHINIYQVWRKSTDIYSSDHQEMKIGTDQNTDSQDETIKPLH